MTAPVGFYVHHHGHGHRARAEAIVRHLRAPAHVLTSTEPSPALRRRAARVIRLPLDTDPSPNPHARAVPTPPGLHYAPVGSAGLRRRMARIAAWAEEARPALLVVDVSAEVALFGRLLGLPVVAMRQHGDRRDAGHRMAYEAAVHLLAPYPAAFEDDTAPADVCARTTYAGGFSRFDGDERLGTTRPEPEHVLVMAGSGGSGFALADVATAARACPDWTWTVLGPHPNGPPLPPNVAAPGWAADPLLHLLRASVVVANAGHNTVMEVAAARRPFICIPEARPFGEQGGKARALARQGAALVLDAWPSARMWPGLLRRATALDPAALVALNDGRSTARAAAVLDGWAAQFAAGPSALATHPQPVT